MDTAAIVVATASDDARLGYGDSIPGEDKRLKESRRRMVDGSQSKRTQSSVIGRCAGHEPAGGPDVSDCQ